MTSTGCRSADRCSWAVGGQAKHPRDAVVVHVVVPPLLGLALVLVVVVVVLVVVAVVVVVVVVGAGGVALVFLAGRGEGGEDLLGVWDLKLPKPVCTGQDAAG